MTLRPSCRPAPARRCFTSPAVEDILRAVTAAIADPELAWMFGNCFPNTLDTTVRQYEKDGKPHTYVITGDIDAMWLRDSTAQVWPYLPLAPRDDALKTLLQGVVRQQAAFVLLDPYANAFYDDPSKPSHWADDRTEMRPGVHERKWELDSLCYVIRLAHGYWERTGDASVFDADWRRAMKLIVATFREQQRRENPGPYTFERLSVNPTDTQCGRGYGNPTRKTGLIHSMFRPSDDGTIYPFLISSNLFAVTSLRQLQTLFSAVLDDRPFAAECGRLADEVDAAIREYGVGTHPFAGRIYALEADGFGNCLFMDDANVPNLLSIPYLGGCGLEDPLYQNTRRFSLSRHNPWFNEGKFARGIGGPHVGQNKIWPLGLVMQALTSTDDAEILYCLRTLKNTHAGTGFIHESFHVDNPADFSRAWFAWANTIFGELILTLHATRPDLLKTAL